MLRSFFAFENLAMGAASEKKAIYTQNIFQKNNRNYKIKY